MDDRGAYNGLSWGTGTSYGVQRIRGTGRPPMRTSDVPRSGDHGSFLGVDLFDERAVLVEFLLKGAKATVDSLLQAADGALTLQAGNLPLSLDNGNRIVFARPRDFDFDRGYSDLGQIVRATARFDATDPRIYDGTLSTATKTLAPGATGVTPPLTPPVVLGAGTSNTFVATNSGRFETRPVAVILGPCPANPRLENVTTGRAVRLNLSLAAGEILVIDFDGRTIDTSPVGANFDTIHTTGLLNPSDRNAYLDSSSAWWSLVPGDNLLRFSADSYDAATSLTLSWRSAYLVL